MNSLPPKRCKNCTFWDSEDWHENGMGECLKALRVTGQVCLPDSMWVSGTMGFPEVGLFTRPDFGCVQFSPKGEAI